MMDLGLFIIPAPSLEAVQIAQAWGIWFQGWAIFLSAIAAIWLVVSARRTNKRRSTLELLRELENGPEMIERRHKFLQLLPPRSEHPLSHWAHPNNKDSGERRTALQICNQYELIAVGIFENTLDEKLYKRWFKSQVMRDWGELQPFVAELRRQTQLPKTFIEFESLVKNWQTRDSHGFLRWAWKKIF